MGVLSLAKIVSHLVVEPDDSVINLRLCVILRVSTM